MDHTFRFSLSEPFSHWWMKTPKLPSPRFNKAWADSGRTPAQQNDQSRYRFEPCGTNSENAFNNPGVYFIAPNTIQEVKNFYFSQHAPNISDLQGPLQQILGFLPNQAGFTPQNYHDGMTTVDASGGDQATAGSVCITGLHPCHPRIFFQ